MILNATRWIVDQTIENMAKPVIIALGREANPQNVKIVKDETRRIFYKDIYPRIETSIANLDNDNLTKVSNSSISTDLADALADLGLPKDAVEPSLVAGLAQKELGLFGKTWYLVIVSTLLALAITGFVFTTTAPPKSLLKGLGAALYFCCTCYTVVVIIAYVVMNFL